MIDEMQKTIAPVDEPLLTEDKTMDDLELLAIANYLKIYKPAFRSIRKK